MRRAPVNRACASSAVTQGINETIGRKRVEAVLPPQADDPEHARSSLDPRLDPADEAVTEQHRQDVVAPASLRSGDVDLPDVVEVEQRTAGGPDPRRTGRAGRGTRRPALPRPLGLGPGCCSASRSQLVGEDEPLAPDALDVDRHRASPLPPARPPAPAASRGVGAVHGRVGSRRPVPQLGTPPAPEQPVRAIARQQLVTTLLSLRSAGRRGVQPGRAARRGRRRAGCPRAARVPGSRPRRAPPGSPGPGSSAASTTRSRPAARCRSTTAGRRAGSAPSSSSTSGACSSNAPPDRARSRFRSQVTRYQGSSAVGRIESPCCRSRTGAGPRTAASPSTRAGSRRSARPGPGRGCVPATSSGSNWSDPSRSTTRMTEAGSAGSERGGRSRCRAAMNRRADARSSCWGDVIPSMVWDASAVGPDRGQRSNLAIGTLQPIRSQPR